MDDAARRVNPASLARLADLRRRREEAAAGALRRLASAHDAAQAARNQAAENVAARETDRRSGERAIYAALTECGPMGLAHLENRQMAVERLGDAVSAARASEAVQVEEAAKASAEYEAGRVEHSRRARETQKWDRACDRISSARRAFEETTEEAEAEDDVSLRYAARVVSSP